MGSDCVGFESAFRKARVPVGALAVMPLGQAGFLFTTGRGVLCVDPYLSNCVEKLVGPEARRMWWNSFRTDELRPDALLITHDHLDHLDPETLPVWELVSPPEVYLGPETVMAHLRALRFRESALRPFPRGSSFDWGGMSLKAVYAEHTEDSIGFVLRTESLSLYVTGDTCMTDRLIGPDTTGCDVLVACVNGIDENLDPAQAVALMKAVGARKLIPMHYGLIPCSTVSEKAVVDAGKEAVCPLRPETAWIIEKIENGIEIRRWML